MENPEQRLIAFNAIQKSFERMGLSRKLLTQLLPLNGKILLNFAMLGTGITFIIVYTVEYVETFSEYTQCIYIASAAVFVISVLLVLVFKVQTLYKYIDCCETMLNRSKFGFGSNPTLFILILTEWSFGI